MFLLPPCPSQMHAAAAMQLLAQPRMMPVTLVVELGVVAAEGKQC